MKLPLHKLITNFLAEKRGLWVRKSDIERFGHAMGYNAYTACRRTQEMCQPTHHNFNPDIEKHEFKGYVSYRHNPSHNAYNAPRQEIKHQSAYCCGNKLKGILVHSGDCPTFKKVKEISLEKTLF
jgi:hypothetical protein